MIIGKDRPRDNADERDELVPIKLIELHRGIAWRQRECRITDHEFGSLECPGDFHRTEMIKLSLRFGIPALVLLVDLNYAAVAQDKLRIAGALAGTWENSFSELGQNAGFFKKRGLVLETGVCAAARPPRSSRALEHRRRRPSPRRAHSRPGRWRPNPRSRFPHHSASPPRPW